MRPVRLSYTRNLACPEKHQRLYQLGEPEPKATFTDDGSLLHEINEDYIIQISRYGLARSTKIYYGVFWNHVELIDSMDRIESMQDIGERWVRYFTIDKRVEQNFAELEMAVNRDFEVIPIAEAIDGAGMARVDCFTGIADYFGLCFGHGVGLHGEWKMGNQMFDMFEAQYDRQIMGYVYLLMKTFPELERISSTKFAPKFNQLSFGNFERGLLVPQFEEYLTAEWRKVDQLRAKYGDGPWPAIENYAEACCFCRLYPYCEPKRRVLAKCPA